jgi:hypothetical protein
VLTSPLVKIVGTNAFGGRLTAAPAPIRRPAALGKVWLGRRADGIKPAADVHLGVSLAAIVPGSGLIGCFRVPSVDGKIGISTPNHKPVDRIRSNESAHFTSEFL